MIVICDIDGTAANIQHRRHYVDKKQHGQKVDWKSFFEAMVNDAVNEWCLELLHALEQANHEIVFVSGRPEDYRQLTTEWLLNNYGIRVNTSTLLMRPSGDSRQDFVIKEEIYEREFKDDKDDILFVIDDRKQVVDMWRSKGLAVLQCDEGDF